MKIEKSFEIDAPRDKVWDFVSSPEQVGMCFPGCQSVSALGDDKYEATIKVKIGPIKTVFDVYFEVTEKREGEYMSYISRGEEGNRASRLKADSSLTLSQLNDHRTGLVYSSDLSIVGRLGKFGLGMMKKKADTMGDEFVSELRTAIEGPREAAVAESATVTKDRAGIGQKVFAVIIALALIAVIAMFIIYLAVQ